VLLYRKHVITRQPYVAQLISQLEAEGIIPVPIFINGVEAHTIVRDQLTSDVEVAAIRSGAQARGTTSPTAPVARAKALPCLCALSCPCQPLHTGVFVPCLRGRPVNFFKFLCL
jgi:magnesium chelatase subunit H